MLLKVLFSSLVLFSFSAQAAESEFFYQADAGQSAFTPQFVYVTGSVRGKSATSDTTMNGFSFGAQYEYGISEMFSVQGTLNYTSVESGDPKQKQSGLNNPALRLKGSSLMGAVHLHFGTEMSIGLEKRSVKSGGDSNASTDGFAIVPYAGFDTEVAGGGMLGASLAYSIQGERNVEYATSGNYKLKGGNSLRISAFYEALLADSIFGGGLNFNSVDEITDQTGVYSKSFTATALFLYSRLPMGGFDLIPRMEYLFSHSELDKAAIIYLGAAARFTF